MMLRKARKARKHTVGNLWKLPLPLPVRRNATDVVIHTRRNTWNTAKPRMLRADLAIKLDIMLNVVRNQGTFQRRVPRESMYLRKLPLPPSFFNESGVGITLADVNMLSKINPSQALVIEFGCGMKATSIDRKLPLKLDTGSDVNAINRKTFQKLFPDAKLTASSSVLQNFDKTCIRPMGTFTTFLRWKGNVYRCQFEVMDSDITPNVLSRKTIFVMKILKTCFSLEQKETSMDDRSSSHTKENTPSVQRSILKRKKPVTSMQKSPQC